jgi:hypothetical protein
MKIQFRFSNGTSELILTPDTDREKTQIAMFREGGKGEAGVRQTAIVTTASGAPPESLVLSTEIEKKEVI